MRTHNITSIEAMLALLEQSLLDVGHVKTLAQHAMNAERPLLGSPSLRQDASGNIGFGTPPAPTSAARLLALYERAKACRNEARDTLETMLGVGMRSATTATQWARFNAKIEEVKSIERAAVEEANQTTTGR
jgi:hypothetical protein